jgi:hypothetical protein
MSKIILCMLLGFVALATFQSAESMSIGEGEDADEEFVNDQEEGKLRRDGSSVDWAFFIQLES